MNGDVCGQCGEDIHGVPHAFPLMLMKYDARLRFCNEHCVEAYDVDNSDDDECEDDVDTLTKRPDHKETP